jgi:hypothetical protein
MSELWVPRSYPFGQLWLSSQPWPRAPCQVYSLPALCTRILPMGLSLSPCKMNAVGSDEHPGPWGSLLLTVKGSKMMSPTLSFQDNFRKHSIPSQSPCDTPSSQSFFWPPSPKYITSIQTLILGLLLGNINLYIVSPLPGWRSRTE